MEGLGEKDWLMNAAPLDPTPGSLSFDSALAPSSSFADPTVKFAWGLPSTFGQDASSLQLDQSSYGDHPVTIVENNGWPLESDLWGVDPENKPSYPPVKPMPMRVKLEETKSRRKSLSEPYKTLNNIDGCSLPPPRHPPMLPPLLLPFPDFQLLNIPKSGKSPQRLRPEGEIRIPPPPHGLGPIYLTTDERESVSTPRASKGLEQSFDHSTSSGRRDTVADHQTMLDLMKGLLNTKTSQKILLECRREKAQQVLDIMQKLLDNPSIDDISRRSILVATLRLCRESGGYPACLTLQGVQREGRPVTDGKFGEIWKGHFRGNVVCMKVVKLYQKSQVEHLIKNFAREAIMWSQLSHPNLLPFYGIYHLDDRVCLVSPWMSDGNISEYLKAHPEAPRRPLIGDILAGLAHLHEKSIVHGDLKGVNILVTSSGTACLADFGLSSVVDADILRWTSLETASCTGGTLRWEAPELFDCSDEDEVLRPTLAADIFSVASVMYEVLTGRIPFYEISRDATVMRRIISGINPSKPSLNVVELELCDEIWGVMEECWSRTPGDRPTVGNIIERFQQIPHNALTIARLVQQQAGEGEGTSHLLTPSSFRAAMQGGNLTFSKSEFLLLKEMTR